MKPRHRFIVAHSRVTGMAILDVDRTPAFEVTQVGDDYSLLHDGQAMRANTEKRARELCAMMNREEEMRESVDAKVNQ
jgi:hydrogenase maturation factor